MSYNKSKLDIFKEINELNYKENNNLLELFSSYVYLKNPDYKYNESYLLDIIPEFWENIKLYSTKVSFKNELLNKIKEINIDPEYKLIVVIDDFWILEFNNKNVENNTWDVNISEQPDLNSIDKDKTYLKCKFCNSQNKIFSDYFISKDNKELIKFVCNAINLFVRKGDKL